MRSQDDRFDHVYGGWLANTWVQLWRAKQRDDALRQQVLTNPHAPETYRANGPLRNVPEFYSTFEVKEGDKMFGARAAHQDLVS